MSQPSPSRHPWHDPLDLLVDADSLPVEHFLTFKVNQLSTTFERQWTRVMREQVGLTLSQWRILAMLHQGRSTFARMVHMTGINKAIVSRTIRELESLALITVEATPDDRRSLTLALTDEGGQLLRKVQPMAICRQQRLLSALTATERRTLYVALEKLARAASVWEVEEPEGDG